MSVPDITLGAKEVLVTQGASGLGVVSTNNTTQFGIVAKISDLCDNFIVGDSIMYDPLKGRPLIYGSTSYVLITEENISSKEVIAP